MSGTTKGVTGYGVGAVWVTVFGVTLKKGRTRKGKGGLLDSSRMRGGGSGGRDQQPLQKMQTRTFKSKSYGRRLEPTMGREIKQEGGFRREPTTEKKKGGGQAFEV